MTATATPSNGHATAVTSPIDVVLPLLRNVVPTANGWAACCPGHDDDQASLSIAVGNDGRLLLNCHAGCPSERVTAGMGLSLRDLFPQNIRHKADRQKKERRTYDDLYSASMALMTWQGREGRELAGHWDYQQADGATRGRILRFNEKAVDGEKPKKTFRPVGITEGGRWVIGDPDGPWPLLYLPAILTRPNAVVCLNEGERKAEFLTKLLDSAGATHLVATASAHGAKLPHKTDWTPLAGRDVVIFGDNDPAGLKYVAAVADKCLSLGCRVKHVRLAGLPPKGDIVDWIELHGDAAEPAAMVAELQEAIAAAGWLDAGQVAAMKAEAERSEAEKAEKAAARDIRQGDARRLLPGAKVRTRDRGNFGTVVADDGEFYSVQFVSPEGNTAVKQFAAKDLIGAGIGASVAETVTAPIELIPSTIFAAAQYRLHYLIRRMIVGGQPMVFGGRSKTMKTSVMIDAAISLGTGTPFLGEFQTEQCTVALLSGESGQFTIQETARRIAAAKGVNLADASVLWGFTLPQLARPADLDMLGELIVANSIRVLFVDPAYLCLLAGDVHGLNASNLFDMGPLLLGLSALGQRTKCTVVLAHHCRKNSPNGEQFNPPDLEELSMSGFAEWARQWVLLGRREAYVQGSGFHRLWFNVGGSAGHSGCYAVDIDEGQLGDDFTGRTWRVGVGTTVEAKLESQKQREQQRMKRQAEKEEDCKRRLQAAMQQFPAGETARILREAAGLNSQNFATGIRFLLAEGKAEACEIAKGNRTHDGYKLTRF